MSNNCIMVQLYSLPVQVLFCNCVSVRSCGQILNNFSGGVWCVTTDKILSGDSGHDADPEIYLMEFLPLR